MSLQNILGNMLSGLAGQMAQGQGKGETLGMEGLSGEFAGAFRQAVEQLSGLKPQGPASDESPEDKPESVPSDEESLIAELEELVAFFSEPRPAPEIAGDKTDGRDDGSLTDIHDSAEPVGDANSQDDLRGDLTMGVIPEGTDAAGLAEANMRIQNASPQAKAILAELVAAWSSQVPAAQTVPAAVSDGAAAETQAPAAMPKLPEMPDLPPHVRIMLAEKGFTFEADAPVSGAQFTPEPVDAAAGSITEKETVNNPASSKAGEAAAFSEAPLPPHSFSKETSKAPVEFPAVRPVTLPEEAEFSEPARLQAAAAEGEKPKAGPKGRFAPDSAELQKAVATLKDVLESAPEHAKPALREVLDKLQVRAESADTVMDKTTPAPEALPAEPVAKAAAEVRVGADVAPSRMANAPVVSSPVSAAALAVDGTSGAEPPVIPNTPSAMPGRSALSLQGATGSSVADQVVSAATFSVQNGRKEVTLQLNPHELGDVRVRLSSDSANQVSARLIAATAEAHELLSQQIESLQKSMEAQGIRVERIQVVLAGEGAQNQAENQSRSDTSHSGAQQHAFQDLAQQHYRGGRQGVFAGAPSAGDIPGVDDSLMPEEASASGENRNANGRVSLLI